MRTLNLGILAHVDAGKTTLTERILFAGGAIDRVGSVDEGTTQTDTLALERERGITIRSAVASFAIGDTAVNILDTPGHPDFIAEVERVLSVLDGAVLVVSAVEGVQSQTPLLFRALRRLRVPTVMFINKIDRLGADDARTLAGIRRRLTEAAVPMGRGAGLGTREARFMPSGADDADFRDSLVELLADQDDQLLAAYIAAADSIPFQWLWQRLVEGTRRAQVHPVFFGSAATGAGVGALVAGIAELLPSASGDPKAEPAGRVFKVERTASGERFAYLRLFSGTLGVRDRVPYGSHLADGKVTALAVFRPGGPVQREPITAGEIARVAGLATVQVGDAVGQLRTLDSEHQFPPPMLESVVVARRAADRGRLAAALAQLAEQDPLINVRQDRPSGEISISLYGEVQKEVIGETLARDYGVEVEFRETSTIFIERPIGTGEALEVLRAATHSNVTGKSAPHSDNPFLATLGIRIEPAPVGAGVEFRLAVDVRLIPLYIFKTVDAFVEHMGRYVGEALKEGLFGWAVTDAQVTVTGCGYRAPGSSVRDFRGVTRLVVMEALQRSGTAVCEPMAALRVEVPSDAVTAVLTLLARHGARVESPESGRELSTVVAVVAARGVDDLRRALPRLTGGEGVLECEFAGYQPIAGSSPIRARATHDFDEPGAARTAAPKGRT